MACRRIPVPRPPLRVQHTPRRRPQAVAARTTSSAGEVLPRCSLAGPTNANAYAGPAPANTGRPWVVGSGRCSRCSPGCLGIRGGCGGGPSLLDRVALGLEPGDRGDIGGPILDRPATNGEWQCQDEVATSRSLQFYLFRRRLSRYSPIAQVTGRNDQVQGARLSFSAAFAARSPPNTPAPHTLHRPSQVGYLFASLRPGIGVSWLSIPTEMGCECGLAPHQPRLGAG